MIGIKAISTYVPENFRDNFQLAQKFGRNKSFVINRLGGHILPVMADEMETSDLCVQALQKLFKKTELNKKDIECLVVVTQNPDGRGLPHTSAIVQSKMELPESLAAFDVSLGCSGFVYGLNIIKGFMDVSGLTTGVLVTADPYSKIVDEHDMNTVMLFGDAAAATLVTSNNPLFYLGANLFYTDGKGADALYNNEGTLHMNGRRVFNFVATKAVEQIIDLLKKENLQINDIDCYVLHQGSRYIVETIADKLGIKEKAVFCMEKTGNTVSSSIPVILEKEMDKIDNKKILISGFGVGFSTGSMILERISR